MKQRSFEKRAFSLSLARLNVVGCFSEVCSYICLEAPVFKDSSMHPKPMAQILAEAVLCDGKLVFQGMITATTNVTNIQFDIYTTNETRH